MKQIGIYFFLILSTLSCTEPDCIDLGGELIGVSFRDEETGQAEPIRINFLQAEGSLDTLVFEIENVSNLALPINPGLDELTLFFDTELGNDTLVIGYNRTARLISEECGTEIIYKNIQVLRSDFDSVRVINSQVILNFQDLDATIENIQIFN